MARNMEGNLPLPWKVLWERVLLSTTTSYDTRMDIVFTEIKRARKRKMRKGEREWKKKPKKLAVKVYHSSGFDHVYIMFVEFMSCILGLSDRSIGLAND